MDTTMLAAIPTAARPAHWTHETTHTDDGLAVEVLLTPDLRALVYAKTPAGVADLHAIEERLNVLVELRHHESAQQSEAQT